jgi:hypothetical protein
LHYQKEEEEEVEEKEEETVEIALLNQVRLQATYYVAEVHYV